MATIPSTLSVSRVSSHFDLQDARFSSIIFETVIPASITVDANASWTAAQLLSGFVIRSGQSAARVDTLPSAAALCQAIQGCFANLSFSVRIRNGAAAANNVSIQPGAGGTFQAGNGPSAAPWVVAQNSDRMIRVVLTNTNIGQEAYTVYATGYGTFNT